MGYGNPLRIEDLGRRRHPEKEKEKTKEEAPISPRSAPNNSSHFPPFTPSLMWKIDEQKRRTAPKSWMIDKNKEHASPNPKPLNPLFLKKTRYDDDDGDDDADAAVFHPPTLHCLRANMPVFLPSPCALRSLPAVLGMLILIPTNTDVWGCGKRCPEMPTPFPHRLYMLVKMGKQNNSQDEPILAVSKCCQYIH